MIAGLDIRADWITVAEESAMLAILGDGGPRGRPSICGRHRIERYGDGVMASGYRAGHKIDAEVPPWLDGVRARIAGELEPNAITVAWYWPGDGVRPHADRKECGEVIAVLSLASDATMRLMPWTKEAHRTLEVAIPRRSLVIMRGEARHDWLHEIPAVSALRIAIILRRAA